MFKKITAFVLQEVKVEEAPRDLWVKQVVSCQKFWFLENVVNLHKTLPAQAPSTQPKGEVVSSTLFLSFFSLQSLPFPSSLLPLPSSLLPSPSPSPSLIYYCLALQLTFTIEAVEILLEGESTSNSHAFPVLALNTSAVVQLFEWTGQVRLMLKLLSFYFCLSLSFLLLL